MCPGQGTEVTLGTGLYHGPGRGSSPGVWGSKTHLWQSPTGHVQGSHGRKTSGGGWIGAGPWRTGDLHAGAWPWLPRQWAQQVQKGPQGSRPGRVLRNHELLTPKSGRTEKGLVFGATKGKREHGKLGDMPGSSGAGARGEGQRGEAGTLARAEPPRRALDAGLRSVAVS